MLGLTDHHRYYFYNKVADMRKGFDLLPKILARLDDGFELWYNSGGRHKEQAREDVRDKGLGRLSDTAMGEAYNETDALLLPSRIEDVV